MFVGLTAIIKIDSMKLKSEVEKQEARIRDSVYVLSEQIEKMKRLDPIAAAKCYKMVVEYLAEKTTVQKQGMFTIDELREYGHMPA